MGRIHDFLLTHHSSKYLGLYGQLPDFQSLLREFSKAGAPAPFEDYALLSISSMHGSCTVFHDTLLSLELVRPGNGGLALVGYYETDYSPGDSLAVVTQLQAVSPGTGKINPYLTNLRWEKLLVSALERCCALAGIRKIGLLPAERNTWFNKRHKEETKRYTRTLQEHQAALKARYNGTARGLHFKYDKAKRLFLKEVPQSPSSEPAPQPDLDSLLVGV